MERQHWGQVQNEAKRVGNLEARKPTRNLVGQSRSELKECGQEGVLEREPVLWLVGWKELRVRLSSLHNWVGNGAIHQENKLGGG